MLQLNHLAINVLAGIVAVWGTTGVWVAASAEESIEPTFTDLCEEFQGVSGNWNGGLYSRPYAWQTMDALMAVLAVSDCGEAEQQLTVVRVLRGPQLQTTYLPDNGLMVDFPVGIDLEVIAIATPNLTDLNLSGHVIPDLTPIASLNQLQTLRLANAQLQDISPLTALTQLTTLDISYNQINSLAPIAQIPTIRSLNVAYNPVTDISPIGEILTPTVEQEWQLLDLSGIDIDTETCPDNLGDICETGFE
ncbi:leucine-rich repeat domain-containing protein [Leptolyngbya sp. Heron Island J]|uniref:leucine-rich repeat domain-containing protein n=1 Tax=Leptolyngbya sp. Heron Island J TaxID=1385935 RepID=UPI001376A2DC|nr:leucine-rich repeat domain-containing protein [Leptolyngbya sp. Heron Island J]